MRTIWTFLWILQEWAWVYLKTISELAMINIFLFYIQDTQIKIMVNKEASLRVSHEWSIYLRYLHRDQNVSIRYLFRSYPQFSSPTVWRHAKKKKIKLYQKQIKGKGGRKPKLILHYERSIIRSLHYARKQDGNFTSKRINLYSGISSVHDRNVRRVFNKYGYHYRQARGKGMLKQ